jgi:hypothetical protein
MKKPTIILLITMVFIVAQPEKKTVQAQSEIACKPDDGYVIYETAPVYGFGITRAEKTYPNYPLIITQDKKHTGVNIVVEIQSYPGTITYETYTETCTGYNKQQKGMASCFPYYSEGKYYYLKGTCMLQTEKVFRYIEGASLKVWLEPTIKTQEWLGWSTDELGDGYYPLRYLFPEKWALGTWTPEGFTTEGDLGLWTEEEIRKFLAEHPGFNFLKADPRHSEIPTQFLPLAQDPIHEEGRVIPLFGDDFAIWRDQGSLPTDDGCLITGRGPGGEGYCAKTVNDQTDPLFGSLDLKADNITYLSVSFSHIPMDIPGEWHIAVRVSVRRAVYGEGRLETMDNYDNLTQLPGREYRHNIPEHTFITYMWISTPCNPAELKGCDN